MQLKCDRVDDYREAHEEIWQSVLEGIRKKGWSNYSLFVRPEDGLIVGYREKAESHEEDPVVDVDGLNEHWQEAMAEYFEGGRPDKAMQLLEEYFHLD
jgi:L-rhamnose mutarotase